MGDWRGRDGFNSGFPAPPARAAPKRRWAYASSPQAAHPSPPRGPRRLARSAASPLPTRPAVLGPRGGPMGDWRGEDWFSSGFPAPPARAARKRRWAYASSPQAAHPSPPRGPRRLARSAASPLPTRPAVLGPRGGPMGDWRGEDWFSSGFPAPPARAARKRRWAYASRREATGSPSPPWGRRAGRSA